MPAGDREEPDVHIGDMPIDRRTYLTERLLAHFRDIHLPVEVGPVPGPFGYTMPGAGPEQEEVFRFDPDVVAAQTAHLDDEQFIAYLDVVEFVADTHVTLYELPFDERLRWVEDELYDCFPGSLRLWTDVQVRALDTAAH
jgi:hypothetical protein